MFVFFSQEIFSKFGQIENLGINDLGNSAPTRDKLEPENKDGVQTGPRLVKANPIDDTIIVEDIEDDQLEINSSDPTRAKEEVSHMIATEQIDPEADEHSPSEKCPNQAKQTTERQGSFDKDLDAYPGLVTIGIESQNELSDSNPKTLPPQAPSLDELLAEKPSFTAKTSPQTPSEIPAVKNELTTDETLEITQKDENY
ncbi:hypothetical protein GQ600_25269 [Phytophthora cactorum]|nr:hypothetical protein GQ600_25269 [Phytophthora cactorum]